MRLVLSLLFFLAVAESLTASDKTVEALSARAARSYDHSEWSSAAAMYMLVSDKDPKAPLPYARVMVAEGMRGDSTALVASLERALSAEVPLDSVLIPFSRETTALGHPDLYEKGLLWSAASLPWLRRRIDVKLLDYYSLRRNAPAMIVYADRILAGVPDNVPTLVLLGRAYAMEGRFDDAVATWKKAEKRRPDDYNLLLELGNYYASEGDDAALPYLRKACEIRPAPFLENMIKQLSSRH